MSIMYFNSLWIIQRVACILYKTARAAAATLKFSKRDAACWSRKGSVMRGSRRQIHRAGRQSIRPVACNTRHSTLHACCNFGFCFCYGFLFLLRSLGLTHTHTHTYSILPAILVETDNLTTRFSVSICCFVVVALLLSLSCCFGQ